MKVLIISHNPISTYNNMGKTMLSLFDQFEKNEISQLYVYPAIPDVDKFLSYFRITDKNAFRGCFTFKCRGREILPDEIDTSKHESFEMAKDEKLYRNKKNKTAFRMLARDTVWKFSHWYNKELVLWIKREMPTSIFVAPGQAKFLYNFALKISKKFNIPIVAYICDDYYFVEKPKNLLKKLQVCLLKNKIEKLMSKTSLLITICKDLEDEYSKRFNVPAVTIMTGAKQSDYKNLKSTNEITQLTYMGNIGRNRYSSIIEVGKALHEINKINNTNFLINVYTNETDSGIISLLQAVPTIVYRGFVSGEEYKKVFEASEAFLHVEAFDRENIDLVKKSISTKIAECLGSGSCLFAYGPSEIASMKYLVENECAIVADQTNLKEKLVLFLENKQLRNDTINKALEVAERNHNIVNNSLKLKQFIIEQEKQVKN